VIAENMLEKLLPPDCFSYLHHKVTQVLSWSLIGVLCLSIFLRMDELCATLVLVLVFLWCGPTW